MRTIEVTVKVTEDEQPLSPGKTLTMAAAKFQNGQPAKIEGTFTMKELEALAKIGQAIEDLHWA